MKPCGCPRRGLTRNVTLWECSTCGECQSSRKRRCQNPECRRVKPAHPRGYGCCAVDWHSGAASCGDLPHAASQPPLHAQNCRDPNCQRCWEGCGRLFEGEDQAKLPHPEHSYYSPQCERGVFTDRRGIVRCVGCLLPEVGVGA